MEQKVRDESLNEYFDCKSTCKNYIELSSHTGFEPGMVSFLQEADTVQSLHLSLREKEEELGRAMKEHLHMASALPTKVENHRCGLHACVVVYT